jgi:small subunit ribosomal protein S8
MQRLADSLAIIQMGSALKLSAVNVHANKKVFHACTLLLELGYITGFTMVNPRLLRVYLKYYRNSPVLRGLKLVSKPSHKVYIKKSNISGKGLSGYTRTNSFLVLSTSLSSRLLTDIECHMFGIGGQALFVVS